MGEFTSTQIRNIYELKYLILKIKPIFFSLTFKYINFVYGQIQLVRLKRDPLFLTLIQHWFLAN